MKVARFAGLIVALAALPAVAQVPVPPSPPGGYKPAAHQPGGYYDEGYDPAAGTAPWHAPAGGPACDCYDQALDMHQIRCQVFCSHWYADFDTLILHRNRAESIKLAEEGSPNPLPATRRPAFLSTDELDFDYDFGPRFAIGRRFDTCRSLELSYFGLHDWDTSAAHAGPEADVPFTSNYTTDFDGATIVTAFYSSEVHNVELNYTVDYCCSAVTPLLGLRYFNLNEDFNLQVTDDVLSSTTQNETSDYQISTENHLLGAQIGGLLDRRVTDCFSWYFVAKAGAYVNMARQSTYMRDVGNTVVLRDFTNHEDEFAFIGELGLFCSYQFSPRLALTAGYQVIWVDGLALAPEQLDFNTRPESGSALRHNGGLLFDGARVGLRVLF
jgi:hypothetical protein